MSGWPELPMHKPRAARWGRWSTSRTSLLVRLSRWLRATFSRRGVIVSGGSPRLTLPHGWDAGMLFEEQDRVLFCSDLFHQLGPREAVTRDDVVGRYGEAIAMMQAHPVLMDYVPFTPQTRDRLETLAQLQPRLLAAMHGSAFEGDGAAALRAAGDVLEQHLGLQTMNSR